MMNYKLDIDEQFKLLIPPLSVSERKQLEENIIQDGCREPLCVWNNTILDGHNRYEICTRRGIPFTIAHIFLKNRDEAVAWICANQLGRRNISEELRWYLIGKRYEAEKKIGAHNSIGVNQHGKKEVRYHNVTEPHHQESIGRTRERLGQEYRISDVTVARYGHYTQAVDALSKADPQLASKILSGKIKLYQDDIVALSHLSAPDIQKVAAWLPEDAVGAIQYIKSRQEMRLKQKSCKSPQPSSSNASIKETPVYDPDAAVESLIFTIPSWIGVMERSALETDYSAISTSAYQNLENALKNLTDTAEIVLELMKETSHEH